MNKDDGKEPPFDPFGNDGLNELFNRIGREAADEIMRRVAKKAQSEWSAKTIAEVRRMGPLAIFTRLITHYPPQTIRALDAELLALGYNPTTATWPSKTQGGGMAGCLGFPDELLPTVLAYYKWRREGLNEHYFCRCHSERN